ncbi:SDR family NAD(P)-dependent oxidoreductase [Streptococcus respiraculi]|uniref:SDR family NAD(P)-dependent oxidoreductase n=1 Tax=Streptococcus respiraculi TaxID=2021971 RepID=UPI000E7559E2|nr:SDR family NAD(P)-dependent oxidoreductase [Streptococcus respiraculi]
MSKTILITGSTDGIGKHLALKLASEGHEVILHGRNPQKLDQALTDIREQVPVARLHTYLADLSQLSDIYRLTADLKRDFTKLDVLVNNAGIFAGQNRQLTKEGVEVTFMLSVLAPYVLTTELLPLLEKADAGRVIHTSSYMHHFARIEEEDFSLEENYTPSLAYNNAKLYTIWLTRYQAEQLEKVGSKVTVNSYHPGLIATNLVKNSRDEKSQKSPSDRSNQFVPKGLDEGIKTGYYLALSNEVESLSGRYFDEKQEKRVSLHGYTPEKAAKLMDYCQQAVANYSTFSVNKPI